MKDKCFCGGLKDARAKICRKCLSKKKNAKIGVLFKEKNHV